MTDGNLVEMRAIKPMMCDSSYHLDMKHPEELRTILATDYHVQAFNPIGRAA